MKYASKNFRKQLNPEAPRQNPNMSQVFLKETWPLDLVCSELALRNVDFVFEVGPGSGVLTSKLLAHGFRVQALEKDKRFVEFLKQSSEFENKISSGQFSIESIDALKFDLTSCIHSLQRISPNYLRFAVVGNIPYSISSDLVIWGLKALASVECILFLTQDEFARRIASVHGTKTYGSLSVFSQLRSKPKYLKKVPAGCFVPVPKVDSALIVFDKPTNQYDNEILDKSEQVCRLAFQQRRKKLHNSILPLLNSKNNLTNSPISLDLRPEVLCPEDFIKIAEWIETLKNS